MHLDSCESSAEQWGHAQLDQQLPHPRQGGMLSAQIIVRELAYKCFSLAINAKIRPHFPSPLPTSRCNERRGICLQRLMRCVVSATTQSLKTKRRAPHNRRRLLHPSTRGYYETITPLLPFGAARIERTSLNMFATPRRVPTVLVSRGHRSAFRAG
jgi:hypothetical protein